MIRRLVLAAVLAFSLTLANTAIAQPSDEIVVTGNRVEEVAQAFAAEVASAPAAEDQYARWNHDLCVSVAGLSAADAQTVVDHISRRATEIGLGAERAGCQPNLVIIFANDSDVIARQIVDTRRDLMGYFTEDDTVTAGREALEAFANTPRAVRWWHISNTTTEDGRSLSNTRTRVGRGTNDALAAAQGNGAAAATTGNGFNGLEATRARGTRLRRVTRQDMSFALVIVDSRRIAGIPAPAVADYVAMASLIQLNPDADMSRFPTVLNLFADHAAGRALTPAMTAWDQAYLNGLYAATREAANTRQQRAEITRRIVDSME
ncbi:MAG: hypothetical protein J0L81_06785 [Caulobacterales bacterium]|jgi:hypothetical protein|nr:hypothetical protein [Caulobacterales bacterium]